VLGRLQAMGAQPVCLNDVLHYSAAVVDELCEPKPEGEGK
jgi:hypothetical protein